MSCNHSKILPSDSFLPFAGPEITDNMSTGSGVVVGSLDNYQQQIRFAIYNNAVVCYYRVAGDCFNYFTAEDRNMIDGELQNIRARMRDGTVTSVEVGEDIVVETGRVCLPGGRSVPFEGVTLYTMGVKFRGIESPPHMLLRRTGDLSDMKITPYYFKDKNKRNRAVEMVNSSKNPSMS